MSKNKEWYSLTKRLAEKVKSEYDSWLCELQKLSRDEIISNAHNIAFLRDVVDLIDEYPDFLSCDSVKILLSLDNTLIEIQEAWSDWDKDIFSDMESTIKNLAEKAIAETETKDAA